MALTVHSETLELEDEKGKKVEVENLAYAA
jgi:hypothetical protein